MQVFALGMSKRFDVSLPVVRQREDIKAAWGAHSTLGGLSFCPTTNTGCLICRPSGTPLPANDNRRSCGDSPLDYNDQHVPVVHRGIIETVYVWPAFIHMKRVIVQKSLSVFRGSGF